MITAFVRTIILYFLIVVGMRLMGKRQIGELEPSELVLTMMISDLAAVPMQDFGIPLLSGLLPILTPVSYTHLDVYKRQVYTIVEQKGNWGRLKSGAGWISLSYTKKV